MLRLQKMELSGFKSFSDRTEVLFPGGITGVVGPNGCGKSNIGDAINWVLGEQSPRQLRGKHMADVIFSGTETRKPLGMAEVSLSLEGAEGLPHADQGRIVVTRRLFRNGESGYLLNGKRARLRDIQDVLALAKVGARTYATIEQGKIDQILNSKPKDRRLIIEDAAGISGYKHKRRLTELKLEATQANLLRVNDIVVEVERQIRSLKRQAAKAKRYRKLRDELRHEERVHFGKRALAADAELTRIRENEKQTRDAETETATAVARLEAIVEEERLALEQANREFRELPDQLHKTDLEIDRKEGIVAGCKEKIAECEQTAGRQSGESSRLSERHREAQAAGCSQSEQIAAGREGLLQLRQRLESAQEELTRTEQSQGELRDEIEELRRRQFETMNVAADSRNRVRSTEEAIERNRRQRDRLHLESTSSRDDLSRLRQAAEEHARDAESERQKLDASRQAARVCEEQLETARSELTAAHDEHSELREKEQALTSRLHTLEDVATRFAGVSDGVKTLLGDSAQTGVQTFGVVADFIEAGADVERAAEGYLSTFLPTVILEDDADVAKAAAYLRESGAGRTSLISRAQPAGGLAVGANSNGCGAPAEILAADSRVGGRLRDQLKLRTSANGVVADRVGDAVLVDSLETALELHARYPEDDYLTSQGDVVYASGVVSAGGRETGDQGLLAHTRQMEETRTRVTAASAATAELKSRVDVRREAVQTLEGELTRRREEQEQVNRLWVELDVEARRVVDEGVKTGKRTEVLEDELAALNSEAEQLTATLEQLGADVVSAEGSHQALERTLDERAQQREQVEAGLKQRLEEVAALRAQVAATQEKQDAIEREGQRIEEDLRELSSRIETLQAEASSAIERSATATELLQRTEAELLEHLAEREATRTLAAKQEHEIGESGRELGERETEVRRLREQLTRQSEAAHEAQLERTRCETSRTHLDELCLQEVGLSAIEAAAAAQQAGVDLAQVDLAQLDQTVAELKDKVERIGPVNMTAIEEFTELEERHAFLTAQREDLEQSMSSLRETIRRINRTSRDRFLEAFEAIRGHYQEIFKLLFNGGRADLRLEESEDVLEAGVEIMVQPPGKRLGSVQLMSGGEKAMSAIALLFAVFRYQPSPFCLLDEVDAALDDANVGRFARMVREYAQNTQFIIITHNKLSMEVSDLIYGVTMEEPGVSKLVSLEFEH